MTPRPRVICGMSSSSKTSILRLSPTRATASPTRPAGRPARRRPRPGSAPACRRGSAPPPPRRRRQSRARRSPRRSSFMPGPVGEHRDDVVLVRRDRSSAATARHGRARRAAGRPRACRTGRWCRTPSAGRWSRRRPQSAAASPSLYFCSAAAMLWPLTARIQPFGRAQHGDRLALDQRLGRDRRSAPGRRPIVGAAPAERRVAAKFGVRSRGPPWRSRVHCRRSLASKRGRAAASSAASASSSLRISISSSRRSARSRMLRIASACTSVRSQRAIISALGSSSSRMMRITSSRLTIDDDLAAQDLHAARDRGEAVPAAPLQHDAAMVEKGLQRLLQVHHPRHAERVEHIEVERHAHFELGQRGTAAPSAPRHRRCGSSARGRAARPRSIRRGRRRAAAAFSLRAAPRSSRSAGPSAPDTASR